MAKQRTVNTRFWRDAYILSLQPIERYLFLWAITNPGTELCGAYEAPMSIIEIETGLEPDVITKALERFARDGKMLYQNGWLIIFNFLGHQHSSNANIKAGIKRTLEECPEWVRDLVLREGKDDDAAAAVNTEDGGGKDNKRGSRLPTPFLLTAEMKEWAKERRPDVDVGLETEKFCNYWRGQPGQKGRKVDWLATWHNWILNAIQKNGTRSSSARTDEEVFAESADFYKNYPL